MVEADATKPSKPKRRAVGIAMTLLAAYGLWLVAGCAVQRSVLFPRHATRQAADPGRGFPTLEINWLETDEGKVETWFVPAPMSPTPSPLVIFCHGNAELIDQQAAIAHGYHKLGCHVLLIEYRGYGRSAGAPAQQKLTNDFVKAYDQAVQRPDVDGARIVFHGRSVGTGVACALAAKRRPAALILRSPFRSVASMAIQFGILRPFVLDPFDNEAVLKKLDAPVLIMHGDQDRVIPPSHGQRLGQLSKNATFIAYEGFGHNDFPVQSPRHWQDLKAFLTWAKVLE